MVSCADGHTVMYPQYGTFPIKKNLVANILPLDTALLRYPFRIKIKDSLALIMDIHNIDNYFHLFHYPEMTHIVSFGHRV